MILLFLITVLCMQTMMTKLEKSPCIVLEYELGLTDADQDEHFLYSKKFLYQKTELYRLGIKVPSRYFQNSPNPPATIFILTTVPPRSKNNTGKEQGSVKNNFRAHHFQRHGPTVARL